MPLEARIGYVHGYVDDQAMFCFAAILLLLASLVWGLGWVW